jgi:hypothetical protein
MHSLTVEMVQYQGDYNNDDEDGIARTAEKLPDDTVKYAVVSLKD